MAAYLSQTYVNRELLVIADGEDIRDLIPEEARLIHLSEQLTIGAKRNYGCERAAGDLICHWDDDDYSAPERIEQQVVVLNDPAISVAGFHTMRFTDGARWWIYNGHQNYALGTSLCYRREWWKAHPFRREQIGEDNWFVNDAFIAKRLLSLDAGDLMYATIHGSNTSPRALGSSWKEIASP